jgi:hypothetical protein
MVPLTYLSSRDAATPIVYNFVSADAKTALYRENNTSKSLLTQNTVSFTFSKTKKTATVVMTIKEFLEVADHVGLLPTADAGFITRTFSHTMPLTVKGSVPHYSGTTFNSGAAGNVHLIYTSDTYSAVSSIFRNIGPSTI